MTSKDFHLEVEIQAALMVVRSFLLDIENHRDLHPFIQSVEPIATENSSKRYRIVDKVPIGPLRLRVTYEAQISEVSEAEIHAEGWQKPRVHLETIYRLRTVASGTLLTEDVRVEAPRLLLGFVTNEARSAHAETLRALKLRLEAPSTN